MRPDIYSYNILINAAAKANKVDAAVQWLHALESDDFVRADVASYNTLLSLFARRHDVDSAVDWYARMQRKVQPDRVTFNAMISMFATLEGEQSFRGIDYYQEMKQHNVLPDGTTMAAIMRIHLQHKQPQAAVDCFLAMEQYRIAPCCHTTAAVMEALVMLEDSERARLFFRGLWQSKQRIDEAVVRALVRTFLSNLDAAMAYLTEERKTGLNVDPCFVGFVLKAVAEEHGSVQAEQWLAAMIRAKMPVDDVVYGIVMSAVARDDVPGRPERCHYWLRRMEREGHQVGVLWCTLECVCLYCVALLAAHGC